MNERFRKDIVPHMKDIVYYPEETDVFDISNHGGISYYIICKDDQKTINICTVRDSKSTNCAIEHQIFNKNTILDTNARKIIDKVLNENFICINDGLDCPKFSYFCSKMACEVNEDTKGNYYIKDNTNYFKISDYHIKEKEDANNYKVYHNKFVDNTTVCRIYNPNEVASRNWCLLGYGSESKCKSIKTYYECKLIWYLVVSAETGSTTNRETWRFVPDPQDWSVIYEDRALPGYTPDENGIYEDNNGNKHCSLYTKYDLSDDEIKIIESVIKERK